MSYCRFSGAGSEAYIYPSIAGIVCCACRLLPKSRKNGFWSYDDFIAVTPAAMLAHARDHNANGVLVPDYAIERLEREAHNEEGK